MPAKLLNAWGYQGDNMNLPVANVEAAAPFYRDMMGFGIDSRSDGPLRSVILSRDRITIGLVENGGDPEQDGCAFEVDNINELRNEFLANGLEAVGEIKREDRDDGSAWNVFFVVAPDWLCYWFGERLSGK